MKKIFIITLCTGIVLTCAACGSSSSSQKNRDYEKTDNYTSYQSGTSSYEKSTSSGSSSGNSSYGSSYGSSKKSNYGSSGSSNKSGSYDYDKGYGYTSPKEGESLSDYIKRQDPELYDSMKERYNNLK